MNETQHISVCITIARNVQLTIGTVQLVLSGDDAQRASNLLQDAADELAGMGHA